MLRQDRFLIGILLGILILVVLALALFFTRQPMLYVSEETPAGIVQNYALALSKGEYERAYGYLADNKYKPTLVEFRQAFLGGRMDISSVGIKLGETEITGDDAIVWITETRMRAGPLDTARSMNEKGILTRQAGNWKIVRLPYPLWDGGWEEQPFKIPPSSTPNPFPTPTRTPTPRLT